MLIKVLSAAVMLAALGACATMSKEECKAADWYLIGIGDAEKGNTKAILDDHRKDCAKAGVIPNLRDFELGYEKGLKTYCTANNGYQQGVSGAGYQGICSGFKAEDFLRGYNSGRELYTARQEVNRVHRDIDRYQNDRYRIQDEVADYERRIVAGNTTPQQRYDYLNRIKELQRDLGNADVNLRNAERESVILEQDLEAVERRHQNIRF